MRIVGACYFIIKQDRFEPIEYKDLAMILEPVFVVIYSVCWRYITARVITAVTASDHYRIITLYGHYSYH